MADTRKEFVTVHDFLVGASSVAINSPLAGGPSSVRRCNATGLADASLLPETQEVVMAAGNGWCE